MCCLRDPDIYVIDLYHIADFVRFVSSISLLLDVIVGLLYPVISLQVSEVNTTV